MTIDRARPGRARRHGPHRRRPLRDRGAAAVEFALVVPLLLLVLFGIVDFARGFNMQITMNEAAAEAARTLAVEQGQSSAVADAKTQAAAVFNGSAISPGSITWKTVTPCGAAGSSTPPPQAVVAITVPFTFTTPIVSSSAGFPITGAGARQCGN